MFVHYNITLSYDVHKATNVPATARTNLLYTVFLNMLGKETQLLEYTPLKSLEPFV